MLDRCPSRVGQFQSRQTSWRNHQMGERMCYSIHLLAIWDLFSTKKMAGVTVENGAINGLYAATSPEALTLGGKVCYSQPSDPMVNLVFLVLGPIHASRRPHSSSPQRRTCQEIVGLV